MANRPTLQVFQTLGLMPTPPLRAELQRPPSLCTAVRSGPALSRPEVGPWPAARRAHGSQDEPADAERKALGDH